MPPILSAIPEIYSRFLPEFFTAPFPEEKFASCSNCAMAGPTQPIERRFRGNLKCCTYFPFLPNYLVGGILEQPADDDGSNRVRRLISEQVGIRPEGLSPSALYKLLYRSAIDGFGKSERLLCPYYQTNTGGCSIWRYRDSVCSTYFCKSIAGRAGTEFWKELAGYLAYVQSSLSLFVLLELGMDTREFLYEGRGTTPSAGKLTVADIDGKVVASDYRTLWASWPDDEVAFYREAFKLVAKLDNAAFSKICGVEQVARLDALRKRYRAVMHVPPILRRGGGAGLVRRADESSYDVQIGHAALSIRVPAAVLDSFNGATSTSDVVRSILLNHGISVEDELISTLYHGGVLVDRDRA